MDGTVKNLFSEAPGKNCCHRLKFKYLKKKKLQNIVNLLIIVINLTEIN